MKSLVGGYRHFGGRNSLVHRHGNSYLIITVFTITNTLTYYKEAKAVPLHATDVFGGEEI
jgi:hypothetical protein